MADRVINFNRGVLIQKEPNTGMRVYMYLDKPGVYYNHMERELPEAIAKKAGIDTEYFAKLKFKQDKMGELSAAIEKELALQEAKAKPVVIETRGEYTLVKIGPRAEVRDGDGNSMSEHPMPYDEAKIFLDILVPKETAAKGKKAEPTPAA